MRNQHIVDSNVGIIANNRIGENTRSAHCVAACVKFLTELMTSGQVVVDLGWEIISEYRHLLNSSGQPGLGDAFLKWVLTNQTNPERCRLVDISATDVPNALSDFDISDHKFIRVAVAAPESPIAQASDSLWWKRRGDFETSGITVNFLCPQDISSLSERKHGPS